LDGAVEVLVVGSDRGLGGQGQRADVLIVARFEADGSARLLSIPRDLVDERSEQRVNQAYEQGVQALIDTVTRITGIPLDHYLEIDAAGLTRLVDDLGGLRVSGGFDLRDELSGLDLAMSACFRLDGVTTLALLRARTSSTGALTGGGSSMGPATSGASPAPRPCSPRPWPAWAPPRPARWRSTASAGPPVQATQRDR